MRETEDGLAIQMRRAAVSIAANIAEGFRKRGKADKAPVHEHGRRLDRGEPVYLVLAQDLGYGNTDALMKSLESVSRLLDSYSKAILASAF